MGADSAVTYPHMYVTDPSGRRRPRILTGVRKVFQIPKIHAGISSWGTGNIGNQTTDAWLSSFIVSQENRYNDIHSFAILLQDELRNVIPEMSAPVGSLEYRYGNRGFHLAGFIEYQGQSVPTFYHIHNGQSEVYPHINSRIINANHDLPPQRVLDNFRMRQIPYIRNGDFFLFSDLFDNLYSSFNQWSNEITIDGRPFVFPDVNKFATPLKAYTEFVRFWIRLVRDVYALSNLPEIIGGDITVLSISSTDELEFSIKP
jgi:hypothetical protein